MVVGKISFLSQRLFSWYKACTCFDFSIFTSRERESTRTKLDWMWCDVLMWLESSWSRVMCVVWRESRAFCRFVNFYTWWIPSRSIQYFLLIPFWFLLFTLLKNKPARVTKDIDILLLLRYIRLKKSAPYQSSSNDIFIRESLKRRKKNRGNRFSAFCIFKKCSLVLLSSSSHDTGTSKISFFCDLCNFIERRLGKITRYHFLQEWWMDTAFWRESQE